VLAALFPGRLDLAPDGSGRYLGAQFNCDIVSLFDFDPGLEFEDLEKSAKTIAGVGF
jgi:hypothetical protein